MTARHRGLLDAMRLSRSSGDLRTLLDSSARVVGESLGFRTVALNLYRPAWDDFEVVVVHGSPATSETLTGTTSSRHDFELLLQPRFRRGGAYLVLQGDHDRDADGVASGAPDSAATDDPGAWRPEDALLLPLRHSEGHLLGILSVDEPTSGRRPDDEELEVLAAVAAGVAQAIESAQDAERYARHRAALERLLAVSTELGRSDSPSAALQLVCDGIAEALGFGLAVIELADHAADRYRPLAAAGIDLEDVDTQLDATIAALNGVFDPEFELEGCYLLTRDEALARVRDEPTSFASTTNGLGPHAWNRHWLVVPLHDRAGAQLGFVWVDDPHDRMIPSRERLQALRLFADQAAVALDAAGQFEAVRAAKQDLERRNRELEALHETTLELIESLEPADALETIVGRAAALLGSDSGYLALVEGDRLVPQVEVGLFSEQPGARMLRGEGLDGRVWMENRPLVVDDYADWPCRSPNVAGDAYRALVAVPLRSGADVIGVLGVGHRAPDRRIEESEIALLARFGHLASLALDNARLLERARRDDDAKRSLIEASPLGIVALDAAGRVVSWNRAAERIFGWTEEEALGRLPPDIQAEQLPEFRAAVARVLAGETITAFEATRRRKDGSPVEISIAAAALRDADGSITGVISMVDDVTAKKRAEAEIERHVAELEALHETTLELITELEPDGTLETIVTRAARLLGTDSGYLALASGEALANAVEIGLFAGYDRQVLTNGEGFRGLVWSRGEAMAVEDHATWPGRQDGDPPDLHALAAAPLRAGTEVIGVLGVGHREEGRTFSAGELQLLDRFAQLASLALANARLYADAKRESEARRALIASAPVAILELDQSGRVNGWNPAAERIFGWSAEEAIGGRPPYMSDEELREIDARNEQVFEGALTVHETTRRRRDGTTVELNVAGAPVRAADGTITGIMAMSLDVTELKRAERRLARQHAELEALHRTTLDLINQTKPAAILETIVEGATRLLEGSRGWIYLVDEDADDLVAAVHHGVYATSIVERIPRGQGLSGHVWATGKALALDDYSSWEHRIARPDDQPTHAMAAVPLKSGATVVGVLGVSRSESRSGYSGGELELLERFGRLAALALDNARLHEESRRELEERRQAEEALRASQALHRKVLDNTTELVSLIDLEGRVVLASASHRAVLGYDPEELVGSTFADFVHPEDLEKASTALSSGEETFVRVRGRDGAWVTIEGSSTPILDESGRAELMLAVARDVTERQRAAEERARLEDQLRQAQKMEAVGRLAGGIAHDFNNLMTAIGGYGELALAQLPADAPVRRNVDEMCRAGERAASLTRQLLAFSRRQVLQPKVTDLNGVVRGLEDMLGRLLGDDIVLVTSLAPDLGSTRVDPGQIEQVVMNLAINARDAMPRGGRLLIETANVELDDRFVERHAGAVAGEYVLLSATDTGEGMTLDTLERVFEPFFTTKPAGQGTGLGLSTVYGIVKQTGGQVWAYSEPGLGASFKVYLPRVAARSEPEGRRSPGVRLTGSETILLVEDEEVLRGLVTEMLEDAGYRVLAAANGDDALAEAAVHDGGIDLLLTDVVMPGLSGQQVAERLASHRPDLPVLFTSGYNEDAIAHHGVLRPGTAFLEKPFTAQELTATLRTLLD